MSSELPTVKQPFLPVSRSFPQESEQLEQQLHQMYGEVANTVNDRVIGLFDVIQVTTGEKWFDDLVSGDAGPIKRRQSYRKVFRRTNIIAGGPADTFAHGISGITIFTRLYGMAVCADGFQRNIPHVSTSTPGISIRASTTQITVTNDLTTNITSAFIVVEYLLN